MDIPLTPTIGPDFEQFWLLYGRKGTKKVARTHWDKLSIKDREACMQSTPDYLASRPEKVYRKDAERYLRDRIWENEIVAPPVSTTTRMVSFGQMNFTTSPDYGNRVAESLRRRIAERGGFRDCAA
jgi:hypothetical protein